MDSKGHRELLKMMEILYGSYAGIHMCPNSLNWPQNGWSIVCTLDLLIKVVLKIALLV